MRGYIGRYEGDNTKILESFNNLLNYTNTNLIACDTETVSITNKTIKCIGIALPDNDNFAFSIDEPTLPWSLLYIPTITKIWHNAPFDLSREALGRYSVDFVNIEDTAMIMRLLNLEVELSLATKLYLDKYYHTQSVKELLKKYNAKDMDGLPLEIVLEKSARDARGCLELYKKFYPSVDKQYYQIKMHSESMLMRQSYRGIKLDTNLNEKFCVELTNERNKYKSICEDKLGFNPLSSQQVVQAFSEIGISLPFSWGKPDTSEEALLTIVNPTIHEIHPYSKLILKVRKFNKLLSTYAEKFRGLSRVYTHLYLDAATGRSTSRDFNIQNIPTGRRPGDIVPKAVRCTIHKNDFVVNDKCSQCGNMRNQFLPDLPELTCIDLGQIELRVFAHLAQDQKLINVLNDPTQDLHTKTQIASKAKDRVQAKNVNFGGLFTGFSFDSIPTVAKGANITNYDLVRNVFMYWRNEFTNSVKYCDYLKEQARKTFTVRTLYGRELQIDLSNKSLTNKHIDNCAINWPVQGSAFEIFERIMIELENIIPKEYFAWEVHDEQVLDGHWDLSKSQIDTLTHISPLYTPFKLEYLKYWR